MAIENQRYQEIEGHFNLVLDQVTREGVGTYFEVYEEYPDSTEGEVRFKTLNAAWNYFDKFIEMIGD